MMRKLHYILLVGLLSIIAPIQCRDHILTEKLAQSVGKKKESACHLKDAFIETIEEGRDGVVIKRYTHIVVSSQLDKIAYIAYLQKEDGSGYIEELYVDNSCRGLQLGSFLLSCAQKQLQKQGCGTITLIAYPFAECSDDEKQKQLPKLVDFYKKHGFEAYGYKCVGQKDCTSQYMRYTPTL